VGVKLVAVRFKGAADPAAEWRQVWAAHERVRGAARDVSESVQALRAYYNRC
jgi:hypothetical protein